MEFCFVPQIASFSEYPNFPHIAPQIMYLVFGFAIFYMTLSEMEENRHKYTPHSLSFQFFVSVFSRKLCLFKTNFSKLTYKCTYYI